MIAAYDWGEAGTPALMLHCMLGRAETWTGLMGALQTPLVARGFDLPGHGRSSPWDGTEDLHAHCTALAQAECPPDAVVIGHSFGATLGLRLALEGRRALRALVLIEPVLFAAARGSPEAKAQEPHDATLASAFATGDLARAARSFLAQWGVGPSFEALPPDQKARVLARMPMIRATAPVLNDDTAGLLRPGGLEGLDLPVLLLRGTDSPAVTGAINRALTARLPRAETDEIAGAGHMAPLTHMRETASRIDRFLAALPTA